MADLCKKPVGSGVVNYSCSEDKDHDGPCAAIEVPASTRERQRWEQARREGDEARRILRETQGEPLTFAQANPAHGPSPVPGTRAKSWDTEAPEVTPEPTKQRPGDQVLPEQSNTRPAIQDILIAELMESKRVGIERYGQPLRPMNGRDTLRDVRDEIRDLMVYLAGYEYERAEFLGRVDGLLERGWTNWSSQDIEDLLNDLKKWLAPQ